jgi:hypothetical protein
VELSEAAARMPGLSVEDRGELRARVLDFVRTQVEPRTRLDESVLYREVARRMRAPLLTTSMSYDHLAIRRFVSDLADADVADAARLQQLLYGLDALIRVHVWKEDELYLRGLEAGAWPAE